MAIQKELLAPCGLYCGGCAIRGAYVSDDPAFKEKVAAGYGVKVEDLQCEGCLSETPFLYCRSCVIKSCTKEKGYDGCYQCSDFPCPHIEAFPFPAGKAVILAAVPEWKQLGTEKWVEAQKKRYTCTACGNPLFRGSKRCRKCKAEVATA
jgi:hypothetical protein